MQDSALDFMVFIIVLGVVVSIGFNLMVPMLKDSRNLYYQENYDKTVGELRGDRAALDYDRCMSRDEIILTVMGQTYFMPKPGTIDIGGVKIEVANNIAFSPRSMDIGVEARDAIDRWFSRFKSSSAFHKFKSPPSNVRNARFKLMFSMNNPNNKYDDTYSLYILLRKNGADAEEELFKCELNGTLKDRNGDVV